MKSSKRCSSNSWLIPLVSFAVVIGVSAAFFMFKCKKSDDGGEDCENQRRGACRRCTPEIDENTNREGLLILLDPMPQPPLHIPEAVVPEPEPIDVPVQEPIVVPSPPPVIESYESIVLRRIAEADRDFQLDMHMAGAYQPWHT